MTWTSHSLLCIRTARWLRPGQRHVESQDLEDGRMDDGWFAILVKFSLKKIAGNLKCKAFPPHCSFVASPLQEQFLLGDGCYLAGFMGQFPEASCTCLPWPVWGRDGMHEIHTDLNLQVPCGWEHIEPPLCGAVTRLQNKPLCHQHLLNAVWHLILWSGVKIGVYVIYVFWYLACRILFNST